MIDLQRVAKVVKERTAPPPPEAHTAAPEVPEIHPDMPKGAPPGGWGPEAPDEKCHYMRITNSIPNSDAISVVSLCGTYEGDGLQADLIQCDPLAPENCTTCRRVLLANLGLI